MVQRKMAIPALGAGVLLAGGLAGHRLIGNWRRNPDPLRGRPVAFPDGNRRMVELPDGAKIKTVTVGEGPTIVCVHGLTSSHHDWGPMASGLLEAGFQLVAVDQRGHGDSTAGAGTYGSSQLAADLATVFEQLDLHAAALMGHSMGGMASMAYAVEHLAAFRQRVESLVLIGTAASLKTVRHTLGLGLGAWAIPAALDPKDERLRLITGLTAFGASPSLHMVDEAIRSFRRCSDDVRSLATGALRDHDLVERLGLIDVPTLVIGGARDQLIRPGQVDELAAGIANSTLHMFDKAGHMLIWERHEEIVELVVEHVGVRQPTATGRSSSDDQPDHEPT